MSDKGEKTCPLCAEEMDLTDQQLKPCKCGYDICVWCWHHIMDMAEKDGSEGRCPACRVPYDKEKIVGMAANCGRVVAEISNERKVKSQKTKGKPSEGRKHLSSVRIVQRNLVYVVGLPLNLGDEDLLQNKDYFGRYGKVLNVSMSRTSTGAIQQFPNNTCSVYITYSKEEEAARCIQAVHGFVLEGRPLRACFGTTKYCHAWLRNLPCSNPDCLYLHEFGSEVDSFTKDEIIPAHTRVQEITGATTNLLFRSGNVLPPPLDENVSNCTVPPEKPVSNNASNAYPSLPSLANPVKVSPPNSSSGRPASLPSASSWAARASSHQPSMTCTTTFDAPGKQKANTTGVPMSFSSIVASTPPNNALIPDENQHTQPKEKLDSSRKKHYGSEFDISSPNKNDSGETSFSEPQKQAADDIILKNSEVIVTVKSAWDDDSTDDDLYTNDKSDRHISIPNVHHGADTVSDIHPGYSELLSDDPLKETKYSEGSNQLTLSVSPAVELEYDSRLSMPSHASSVVYPEVDEDVRSFNIQRLSDSQVVTCAPHLLNAATLNVSNHAKNPPIHMKNNSGSISMIGNFSSMGISAHEDSHPASCTRVLSNGYHNYLTGENGYLFPDAAENQINGSESHEYSATDLGENSIISEILSMDLESDSSLAAKNLARLFSDIDKPDGSQLPSTSWNAQSKNNNQSRFSFARQDKANFQTCAESSHSNFSQPYFRNNITESRYQYQDQVGHNSFGFNNFEGYNIASRTQAAMASNRSSASRSPPVSAPPGFSIPSRTVPPPPPGFTSFERADTFNAQPGHSGNHPLFRRPSEVTPNGNMDINGDIEFMDPAILAVGKGRLPINGSQNYDAGMRSNFHSEFDGYGDETRLKLVMQRSLTPQGAHQNCFSFPNDVYGGYAQNIGQQQNQANMYSPFLQNSQPRNGQQQNQENMYSPFPQNSQARNGQQQNQENMYSPFPQNSQARNGQQQNQENMYSPFLQNSQARNGQQQNQENMYSPFLQNSQPKNGQQQHHEGWRDLSSQQQSNDITMLDLVMNERLGLNFNKSYNNGFEEAAFCMPSSADLYNRSLGM